MPSEVRIAALLMTLAERKGFALDVCPEPDRWRLIGGSLKPVVAPDGGNAFTSTEARAFLLSRPDR